MQNIRYIGSKPQEDAYFAETGIIWTPGLVSTVLDEVVAQRMLEHPDVFQDAGDADIAALDGRMDAVEAGGGGPPVSAINLTDTISIRQGATAGTGTVDQLLRASRPATVKTLRNLAFIQSTNTATDGTARYVAHIDITPAEFPFFAEGFAVEVEAYIESGTQGVQPVNRVTAGTVVRSAQLRIGRPDENVIGETTGLSLIQAPTLSTAQTSGVLTCFGVSRSENAGVGAEFISGGAGYPGFVSTAIATSAVDFKPAGMRVAVSAHFTSAVAGHIFKVLFFRVRLTP